MGKDCTDSKIVYEYDFEGTPGYNAVGAFEIVLINLGVINEDFIADIEDTERFSEYFTTTGRSLTTGRFEPQTR